MCKYQVNYMKKLCFASENTNDHSTKPNCSFMQSFSDLVKIHLACESWPMSISICHFQTCCTLPGLVLASFALASIMRSTYLFLFSGASLHSTLSQKLNRFPLDCYPAWLNIIYNSLINS